VRGCAECAWLALLVGQGWFGSLELCHFPSQTNQLPLEDIGSTLAANAFALNPVYGSGIKTTLFTVHGIIRLRIVGVRATELEPGESGLGIADNFNGTVLDTTSNNFEGAGVAFFRVAIETKVRDKD